MKYLLALLLLIFPLGQFGRFELAGSEIVLHVNDLAIALVLFISLFLRRKSIFNLIKKASITKALFLWLLAILISLLANINSLSTRQLLVSSLYPIRFFAYAGLYFVFKSDPNLKNGKYQRLFLLSALITSIAGVIQYIFVPDVSFLSAFNWDNHYYRLVGTFLDPGFTGALLALGLIAIYSLKELDFWDKLSLVTVYGALSLTYSRASYLTYLVVFGLTAFFKRSLKIFILASLVLLITLFILPKPGGEGTRLGRENSIVARIENWQQALSIWSKHPLFGVGFDSYRYTQNQPAESHSGAGSDSSLFLVLATTGIFGFFAYLFLLGSLWQHGSWVFKASLAGVFVHSFFNNTLFYPWVMEWLWLLLVVF